jgi:hypothetical protein
MPGKRLEVRAASSSVPWRNAQPTSPSVPPAKIANVAADSPTSVSSNAPAIQQPKIKDLVGYTAVLSIKAVDKQEDRVLGIVKEVGSHLFLYLFARSLTLLTKTVFIFIFLTLFLYINADYWCF